MHYSGYTEEELMPVFELLLDYCSGDVRHEAFDNKYASKKFLRGESYSTGQIVLLTFGYQLLLSFEHGQNDTLSNATRWLLLPRLPLLAELRPPNSLTDPQSFVNVFYE